MEKKEKQGTDALLGHACMVWSDMLNHCDDHGVEGFPTIQKLSDGAHAITYLAYPRARRQVSWRYEEQARGLPGHREIGKK